MAAMRYSSAEARKDDMSIKAIGLLKLLAQGEEDVRAGRTVHQGKVFGHLRRQLKARGRKDA